MNKLKTTLLAAIALFAVTGANAQAFKKGDNIVSLGYGAPNLEKALYKSFQDYTDFKLVGIGPLHAKFEHGITDKIGIGVSINAIDNSFSYTSSGSKYAYDRTSVKFNARMNFHFGDAEKFDPYFGFGIGYGVTSYKVTGAVAVKNPVPIGFETTLGARYYFTDNIGIYGEVGLAKSIIQAGVSFKF